MKFIFKLFIFGSCMLLMLRCANVGQIQGGPKDTTPPQINTEKSTPNFQKRLKPEKITLSFDEFVSLQSPYANIIISPPLSKKFKVLNKGKTIEIIFDKEEEWKENTTYAIQFGDAIKDYNEGNIAKNINFLFTTGDDIDSLQIKGKVIDAFTGEPVKDVLVMLYDRLDDSLPVKEKPYYFAKTNTSGDFHLQYLKQDTFLLFALKDENRNYKHDLPKEGIGFIDSTIVLKDSFPFLNIKLFTPETPPRIVDWKSGHNMFKIVWNKPVTGSEVRTLSGDTLPMLSLLDTVTVFLPSAVKDSFPLVVMLDKKPIDTLFFIPGKNEFHLPAKMTISKITPRYEGKPKGWLAFPNQWLIPDKTKMQLWKDSVSLADSLWQLEATSPQGPWKLDYPWKLDNRHRLLLLPGALRNAEDSVLQDTLEMQLPVVNVEEMSSITVKLTHPTIGKKMLILLETDNKTLRTRCFTVKDSTETFQWNIVPPGQYQLRIIEDMNGNCRWDSGNWWERRQAEPVIIKKLDKLRANWDTEVLLQGF